MSVETVYETVINTENLLDYPKMYRIVRDGGQEYARVLAEFADAPEGVVSEYISIFKTYILNLVESISEIDVSDQEWEAKVGTLMSASAYLKSAVPAYVEPLEEEIVE